MLKYQLFPRSQGITEQILEVIGCFKEKYEKIKSPENKLNSDEVLNVLRSDLEKIGFKVETGKAKGQKIPVPVLFGLNNEIDQSFNADAVSGDGKIVLEVEAGRATAGFAFLKDIFQASMMHGVEFLILAVRNDYRGGDDFQKVYTFLETLYISSRLVLPLKGIILIGY
ncbi:hypothetical protein C6500_00850 [Candidatus Poribacteria bacterium]|nr:MAG: hypothetical protein C6500_00850 [Candidatus Poribacteria bacterium]